jgi:crotonyl-CoA carboxylase/reductase
MGGRGRAGLAGRAAGDAAGAKAVGVVSSKDKGEFATSLGAAGYIDRTAFDHWGVPPRWDDPEWKTWFDGAKAFGKAIWDVVGERRSPNIVFEHPGQDTIPTSIFVCERGGMVVICAGTTGYDTVVDVRYLWYMQKRYQGSTCSTTSRRRRSTTWSARAAFGPRSATSTTTRSPGASTR